MPSSPIFNRKSVKVGPLGRIGWTVSNCIILDNTELEHVWFHSTTSSILYIIYPNMMGRVVQWVQDTKMQFRFKKRKRKHEHMLVSFL